MRNINISILALLFVVITSCSDREDGFREYNSKPYIQFVKLQADTSALLNTLTDSIRFSTDTNTFYNVRVRLGDADENLYRCQILIDSGKIHAYYKGDFMQNPTLRVDQEFVDLSLVPQQVGKNNITFRLEDKFNDISEAKLELFVFDNLLPVAQFTDTQSNPEIHEFTFDASSSYDRDQNYGGKIAAYEWSIDGFTFTTPKPIVKHVFSKGGTYTVRLRVMDNNEAYSQTIERKITI